MTIDVDTLTLGELKQIAQLAALFGYAAQSAPVAAQQTPHPFVGKYVICRCYSAGVHAGELVSLDSDQAILKDSRRLWSWQTPQGVALSGVAQHGLVKDACKVDVINPEIALTGVIEVIPCSDSARSSIHDYK